jgi:hypothetical protein
MMLREDERGPDLLRDDEDSDLVRSHFPPNIIAEVIRPPSHFPPQPPL